jgi:hypothetical protein
MVETKECAGTEQTNYRFVPAKNQPKSGAKQGKRTFAEMN